MTDDELRAMVRAAIARHQAGAIEPDPAAPLRSHASFLVMPVLRGSDADGACLIEPAVRCNHCGYCASYGH